MYNQLLKEKSEHLERITVFLTPRINGVIDCSATEKDAYEEERQMKSERIAQIDAELEGMTLPETPTEPILAMVDGLPLESLTKNEDAAIMIRLEVESLVDGINKESNGTVARLLEKLELSVQTTEKVTQDRDKLKVEVTRLIETLNESTVNYNDLFSRYEEKESLFNQLTLERDQAFLYRDNAKAQLENMAFELEQNRIELNRNREVRALTEAERTSEKEAARQRFMDSRIKVYNPRWEDYTQKRYLAERAEDGVTISYGYLEIGGYLEISEDEALAIQAMNKPIEMPEVNEVEIFPTSESGEGTQDTNATEDQGEQREAMEVEPETFEERTERRLNALELRANRNDFIILDGVA